MSRVIMMFAVATSDNQDDFVKELEKAFAKGSNDMRDKGFTDYKESIQYTPTAVGNKLIYTATITWEVEQGETK